MRLASQGSIQALFRDFERSSRPPKRCDTGVRLRPSGGGARRCTCGTCKQCLENARWERIFKEKFEDPSYYTRRTTSMASPLASIR
jgi:hypothetical protein